MAQHHHKTGTYEWCAWDKMRKRCGVTSRRVDPNKLRGIPKYVDRGMAEEWKDDFSIFLKYVLEHLGPHPGKGWSLDRIDNDRGYFPGNIRWMPLTYQRKQGGMVPHQIPIMTEARRQALADAGRKGGRRNTEFCQRNANGQFARNSNDH